jgi:hypothetical protein
MNRSHIGTGVFMSGFSLKGLGCLMPAAFLLVSAAGLAGADEPVVNITAMNPDASEVGPINGLLIVTREGGDMEKPLTVTFKLSGTATMGTDYEDPGTSVTIEANAPFAQFEIVPLADALTEGPETVNISLEPGAYGPGSDASAEVTIADAAGDPGEQDVSEAPPADLAGTLTVSMVFEGSGQFSDKRAGTFANVNHHHEFHYSVPLRGTYAPASGIAEIDQREMIGANGLPDFERFIIWTPMKALDAPPRFCGSGKTRISDERSGKEISNVGGLVPFNETVTGGGDYPSLDPTVTEYDLCTTLAVFDTKKQVYYLRMEGADTNVRVINRHNGIPIPEYNDRIYGQDGDFRAKLVFFDLPIAGDGTNIEGSKLYENFNEVKRSDVTNFPIDATIKWKITQP